MKNLKLLALLCAVLFVNSASAQWSLSGNTLTRTSFLGSNNNFDIIVKRNGVQSGLLNTASSNTSWGVSALNPSTTGTLNTALGSTALTANTTGYNNIAIGSGALTTNTSGYQNVGIGTGALAVSNGQANVAIGSYSLVANTSGPNNTGVGYQSLGANTTGQQSVGLGYQALVGNTTGSNNVGVGYHTLTVNTTGSNNMALGYNANVGSAALTNATAIGAGAVANLSNSIVLGNGSVNVGVGTSSPNASALLDLTSTTQGLLPPRIALTATNSASPLAANVAGMILYNTATAGTSPNNVTPGYYYNNGSAWVRLTDASSPGWSLTGNAGTTPGTNFIGTTDDKDLIFKVDNLQAGLIDYDHLNTALGIQAFNPSSTGSDNISIGYLALANNTTGLQNVATGDGALNYNTTGSNNSAIGGGAMVNNTTGIAGTAIGSGALSLNTTGNQNTAIGNETLLSNTTGGYNVGVGTGAGGFNATGFYNTSIGGGSGPYVDGLNNTSSFGADAYTHASNTMAFGDTDVVGWGFAAARPTATNVFIVGTNSTNGNGAYLTSGGMWMNASDKNLKEDFSSPDSKDVLEKIKKLSVTKWKYKGTSEYHIGPMAQDFYDAFNLGTDNKHIGTTDPAGIALIAIQELAQQNDSLQNANAQQQAINAQQEELNNNLQTQLNNLKTTISQMQTAMSLCCNSYTSNMATAARPQVVTGVDAASLQQNSPNPYNGNTVIAYHLPQSATNAEIIVSTVTGTVIKSVSLNGNGDGQVMLNAGALASGTYFYTLLVNGQKIDTKEMIIAN
jgi:hypothetical protein